MSSSNTIVRGGRRLSPQESEVVSHLERAGKSSLDFSVDREWLTGISNHPEVLVHRMAAKGLIHRIQTGRYVVSADPRPMEVPVFDSIEWLSTAVLGRFSDMEHYVSWQTALYHHRLIEQQPRTVFIAVTRRKRPATIGSFKLRFVTVTERKFFGYEQVKLRGGIANIADVEKTVIDALDRPELSAAVPLTVAGMVAAWREGRLDPEKLVAYALRFDTPTLNRRLGLFMDHFRIPDSGPLVHRLGRGYEVPLRPGGSTDGLKVDPKWQVAVDRRLLQIAASPK